VGGGRRDGRQDGGAPLSLLLLPDHLFRHADDLREPGDEARHLATESVGRHLILAADQFDELVHPEPGQDVGDMKVGKSPGPTRPRPSGLQHRQELARLGHVILQRPQPPSRAAAAGVGLGDRQEQLRVPGQARRQILRPVRPVQRPQQLEHALVLTQDSGRFGDLEPVTAILWRDSL